MKMSLHAESPNSAVMLKYHAQFLFLYFFCEELQQQQQQQQDDTTLFVPQ